MVNLPGLNTAAKTTVRLATHERNSVLKRIKQIAVALGHPQRTPEQSKTLIRERVELEHTLAADSSDQ